MASEAMKAAVAEISAGELSPEAGIDDFRASYDGLAELFPPNPAVSMSRCDLDSVRSFRFVPPRSHDDRALLYLHGGGYALGSTQSHCMIVSYLALGLECPVHFPEYRLAPEHRFPAAIDDVVAAWQALLALGYDANQVAIAGDSAGGGLVFALMIRLRELGLSMPGSAYAISPWSDMEGDDGWRLGPPDRDPFLKVEELAFFAETYVDAKDYRHPWVAPMYGDLSGLAPVLIQAAHNELLFEDARRLTIAIEQAGGDVVFEVEPDAPHVWHHFVPEVPEAVNALDSGIRFIREHWEEA